MGKALPIRRSQFKVAAFAQWLTANGAEICQPTNPYEVIRYRAYTPGATKAGTHIVYAKDTGALTFAGVTRAHYEAFLRGDAIPGMFVSQLDAKPEKGKSKGAVTRQALLERDGDECWFCGLPVGEDATIEHLVPKSAGGGNKLANYALAHAACNHKAADMPLVQKIELRANLRAERAPC